jgi:hypothetical protein
MQHGQSSRVSLININSVTHDVANCGVLDRLRMLDVKYQQVALIIVNVAKAFLFEFLEERQFRLWNFGADLLPVVNYLFGGLKQGRHSRFR